VAGCLVCGLSDKKDGNEKALGPPPPKLPPHQNPTPSATFGKLYVGGQASDHMLSYHYGDSQPPPCPGVCKEFFSQNWLRIYSCSGNADFRFDFSYSNIQSYAQLSTSILIMSDSGYSQKWAISNPNTYPIQQLRAGQTISYKIGGGTNSMTDINATWVASPPDVLSHLWNSCGSPQPIYTSLYWACNNVNGLHLVPHKACTISFMEFLWKSTAHF